MLNVPSGSLDRSTGSLGAEYQGLQVVCCAITQRRRHNYFHKLKHAHLSW